MADVASDDLLDIDEVCAFFGGTKPLHPSTIWRGGGVRFPKPVNIGPEHRPMAAIRVRRGAAEAD